MSVKCTKLGSAGQERADLERVLKTNLRIIWGSEYTTFQQVLQESHLKLLQETQTKIVQKFVRKTACNKMFSRWFTKQASTNFTTRADTRSLINQSLPSLTSSRNPASLN